MPISLLEVLYNYLAPGSYTFQVKTENTDGITSSEIASLANYRKAAILEHLVVLWISDFIDHYHICML